MTMARANEFVMFPGPNILLAQIGAAAFADGVPANYAAFRTLLRPVVRKYVRVEVSFVLRTYPLVAAAYRNGDIVDVKGYVVEQGYFDGVVPCSCPFDEESYASEYPDVVASGTSPFSHWLSWGYREGRRPSREVRYRDMRGLL